MNILSTQHSPMISHFHNINAMTRTKIIWSIFHIFCPHLLSCSYCSWQRRKVPFFSHFRLLPAYTLHFRGKYYIVLYLRHYNYLTCATFKLCICLHAQLLCGRCCSYTRLRTFRQSWGVNTPSTWGQSEVRNIDHPLQTTPDQQTSPQNFPTFSLLTLRPSWYILVEWAQPRLWTHVHIIKYNSCFKKILHEIHNALLCCCRGTNT